MKVEETETSQVLIVGAGVAGAALAIALRKAGIAAVVYEASPQPRDDAGAFMNLAPNGLRVLSALGLNARTDGIGFKNDRLIFRNDSGRLLADVQVGGVTLMRGALSRALREAAIELGVRFEFGKFLESCVQSHGAVTLRFRDGSGALGRALIGADGIHSRVRREVFPKALKPTYTGILNLGGIVRTDLASTGSAMHMIFGRRGFFGYAVRPTGDTYWFSNFAEPDEPGEPGEVAVDADEMKARLIALHSDDPPEVGKILCAVTGSIGSHAVYDIMTLPRWHQGKVCLIGDAAHAVGPHVGQGASLALEDAFLLAKCLRDIASPEAAFARFEGMRRQRVEGVLKQSRATGSHKAPKNWLARRVRDLILPIFLRKGAASTEWLYAYPANWDERVLASQPDASMA